MYVSSSDEGVSKWMFWIRRLKTGAWHSVTCQSVGIDIIPIISNITIALTMACRGAPCSYRCYFIVKNILIRPLRSIYLNGKGKAFDLWCVGISVTSPPNCVRVGLHKVTVSDRFSAFIIWCTAISAWPKLRLSKVLWNLNYIIENQWKVRQSFPLFLI